MTGAGSFPPGHCLQGDKVPDMVRHVVRRLADRIAVYERFGTQLAEPGFDPLGLPYGEVQVRCRLPVGDPVLTETFQDIELPRLFQ